MMNHRVLRPVNPFSTGVAGWINDDRLIARRFSGHPTSHLKVKKV